MRVLQLGTVVALAVAAPGAAAADGYSLPWQLRPAAIKTGLRSDSAIAFYDSGGSGHALATILGGSYAVLPTLGVSARIGLVYNAPPGPDSNAAAATNLALGGTYLIELLPELKLGLFLGLALPTASGGGNRPDPATLLATRVGLLARSAMDNALFAVNDITIFPAIDLAFVSGGLTVQAEATLLELIRVRGEQAQTDAAKSNFTAGVHVGYFLRPEVSIGMELRHQRFFSTPAAVAKDPSTRENTTIAVGPRLHLALGPELQFLPGLAFAAGLSGPVRASMYRIVQVDLVLTF
jgi:hypothetical protein